MFRSKVLIYKTVDISFYTLSNPFWCRGTPLWEALVTPPNTETSTHGIFVCMHVYCLCAYTGPVEPRVLNQVVLSSLQVATTGKTWPDITYITPIQIHPRALPEILVPTYPAGVYSALIISSDWAIETRKYVCTYIYISQVVRHFSRAVVKWVVRRVGHRHGACKVVLLHDAFLLANNDRTWGVGLSLWWGSSMPALPTCADSIVRLAREARGWQKRFFGSRSRDTTFDSFLCWAVVLNLFLPAARLCRFQTSVLRSVYVCMHISSLGYWVCTCIYRFFRHGCQ